MPNTRFIKHILGILLCGLFALFYVHQEIEIIKTGFLVSRHRHKLSFLLDQHRSLIYNLSQLESPKRLEDTLYVNEIVLCMPEIKNMRHLDRITLVYHGEEKAKTESKVSFLASIFDRFSIKAEAKVAR